MSEPPGSLAARRRSPLARLDSLAAGYVAAAIGDVVKEAVRELTAPQAAMHRSGADPC
jgi:hypothetical protein